MRIIVVDDDSIIRRYVIRMLLGEAQVVEASGPHEALNIFEKEKFDAALVDVNMGAENGIDLAVTLRNLDPHLKIIVMSGDPTNEEKVSTKGFGQMLMKPFTVDELKQRLLFD